LEKQKRSIGDTIKAVSTLTLRQLQSRKDKAVRFLRDVLNDPDRAEEVQEETLDDYAKRRRIQLLNPTRRKSQVPTGQTKADLARTLDEIADLTDEALDPENSREDVVRKLKDIAGLAEGDTGEEEDEEEEDDGED
jgi:hypothetical protein